MPYPHLLSRYWILALAMLTVTSARAATPRGPLMLAANGKSAYVILLDPDAPLPERTAAEELQTYLQRMSGAKLPIVPRAGKAPFLAVGRGSATRALPVPSRYEGDDAVRIRTVGRNVLLKGATPRGTLYAVYELLERQGCWWFAPDTPALHPYQELVPRKVALTLPPLDLLQRPRMRYRKQDMDLGEHSHTPETWPGLIAWAARNRSNTLAIGLGLYEDNRAVIRREAARFGLRLEVGKHEVTRAFLPPEKYFQLHPEWYAMRNGKREPMGKVFGAMFETGNPEAVAEFNRNIVAWLKDHPEVDVLQVWGPDANEWSESPEANALGAPSERLAKLVQDVSRAIHAAGLRTQVAFLAYMGTIEPPKSMDFPRDMVVEFCPIDRSYAVPFDAPASAQTGGRPEYPRNAQYAAWLREWIARFPGEVSHYSYYAKYSWRSLPVALPEQIGHDMATWRSIGEVGASIYAEPGNWLALEVNHDAFARAAWDERFDGARWFDAYLGARYGGAAPAMKRFYRAATKASLGGLIMQSYTPDPTVYTPTVEEARSALKEANALADTPAAKWMVGKLAWEPDYIDASLRVREAEVAHRPKAEIDALRRNVTALTDPHVNDGTYIR